MVNLIASQHLRRSVIIGETAQHIELFTRSIVLFLIFHSKVLDPIRPDLQNRCEIAQSRTVYTLATNKMVRKVGFYYPLSAWYTKQLEVLFPEEKLCSITSVFEEPYTLI